MVTKQRGRSLFGFMFKEIHINFSRLKSLLKYLLIFGIFLFLLYINPWKVQENYIILPTPTPSTFSSDKLLSLINEWRVAQELLPLIKSSALCDTATVRAVEIANDWSHNGFSAERLCRKLECEVGENLAESYIDEQEVLNAWINSPAHLEVLVSPSYKYGCVSNLSGFTVLHVSDINLR